MKRVHLRRVAAESGFRMVKLFALAMSTVSAFLQFGCGPGFNDFEESLGRDFLFVSAGTLDKYILQDERIAIRNFVAEYAYDSEWIIAIRAVAREVECGPDRVLDYHFSGEQEYWIISKRTGEIYGPLDAKGYSNRRRELNVSQSLQVDPSAASRAIALAAKYRDEAPERLGGCNEISPR